MKLIGREHIHRLRGRDERLDRWLVCWETEVFSAHWKSSKDLLSQFPNAVEHATNRFLFPITQTTLKVAVMINFTNQIVLALPNSTDLA